MIRVRVVATVKPTEDVEKVKKAVENVFSGEITVIEEGNGYYRVEGYSGSRDSLDKLYNLIRIEQILPAARNYLLKNMRDRYITIYLHKQAAFMNKLSFIDSDRESPLGAIRIEIETDDPMKLIDWLAPPYKPHKKTGHGKSRRARKQRLRELEK